MYYVATENKLVRQIMLTNMKELSQEIIKRDGTKVELFNKFFKTLELVNEQ